MRANLSFFCWQNFGAVLRNLSNALGGYIDIKDPCNVSQYSATAMQKGSSLWCWFNNFIHFYSDSFFIEPREHRLLVWTVKLFLQIMTNAISRNTLISQFKDQLNLKSHSVNAMLSTKPQLMKEILSKMIIMQPYIMLWICIYIGRCADKQNTNHSVVSAP